MKQVPVFQVEEEVERQISSHFRGRARVPLEFLHFSGHSPRDLDHDNVQRLVSVYREEGVKRLQYEHHVPAVVGKDDLTRALELSGLSVVALLNNSQSNPPQLKFPEGFRLECLHGKHRIEAAKYSDCLQGENRWWTVTLYSEGLSTQARRSLIDDYSNSQNFSDGTIFRKIIEYETSDDYSRQHWWSWLTDCKKDILGRIFSHVAFNAALRKLALIPALLEDLNISLWHKIIATRSDEEFLHYIDHILATFDHICGKQKHLWISLDRETVALVQSRCPGTSLNDLEFLERLIHKKRIFRAVDDATRQDIWTRLRDIKHLIPTLGSLQHDFKYIRGPALAVYKLLSPPRNKRQGRRTLRNLAESAFLMPRHPGKVTIQTTNNSTEEIAGDENDQFEIGFQQLYLFAMRESWNLVNDCPLRERARGKPLARSPDPIVWHDFAELAYALGFKSVEVQRLRQINPFEQKARQVLLDKQGWRYEDALIQRLLADTEQLYRTRSYDSSSLQHGLQMLTDGPGEPIDRRRGRCYENAYDRDKQHMFIKTLFEPVHDRAHSVTSLFVRKSVHQSFFPSWNIGRRAPVVSEPKENINGSKTGEQNHNIDMPDAADFSRSSSDAGTDSAIAEKQHADIDMPDAAGVSRSSQTPPDLDASSHLHATLANNSQECNLPTNQGLEDRFISTLFTTSTGIRNESIEKERSASSDTPGSALIPAPSSALQPVSVTNVQNWSKKRPQTGVDLQTIEGQSPSEYTSDSENPRALRLQFISSSTPESALIPAPSSALQPVSVTNVQNWSRKRPRIDVDLQTIEVQSPSEHMGSGEHADNTKNQIVTETLNTSSTSRRGTWRDSHPEGVSLTEVTIWTDSSGEWEELRDSRCNNSKQVQELIGKLMEEQECYPSDDQRQRIMASECYELAIRPRGDLRVYITIGEEL